MIEKSRKPRVLSVFSLVMINVIAVDSLRTLPIAAEYGFSLVFFYVLGGLLFFIPTALVSAELATGWPQTGGLYIWVREAFGERIGFLAIWIQWVYNIVWYPTILSFVAATMAYLINPALSNHKTYLLTANIIIFTLATIVNWFGIRVSSWVSEFGAIVGTIIPMVFIIILSGFWVFSHHPIQIEMTTTQFFPSLIHLDNLVFFVGLLFGLVGMEMSAVHAGDVENPKRDYPRALLYSAMIILGSLTLASLAIALVVPKKDLSLVSGLLDAFSIFLKSFNLQWLQPVIVCTIIIGAFCSVSAWILGPARGVLIALKDSKILHQFAHTNRYNAPGPLLLLQLAIFLALCSVFVFMPTVNSYYWMLSALTAQLALIGYILMFAACIALRYKKPDVKRGFTIPGNHLGVWIVSLIGIITCVLAIFIGFLPPSGINVGNIYFYEIFLWGGIIILSLPPFLIRFSGSYQG